MNIVSKTLLAGVALGALTVAQANASPTNLATIDYFYNFNDTVTATVTNDTGTTLANVTVQGVNIGSLAGGATSGGFNIGDPDDFTGNISGSVMVGANTFTGLFGLDGNLAGDNYGTSGVVGTIVGSVPEPASMAVLGMGLLAVGAARRRTA
ncbi:MAG: PEP-CTERM sorting domain-containing protein [Acetobacteraceae bacterium]